MQKLIITQALLQKLSPQQIQFIKLLQIPSAELDSRIKEEIEINPALEEGQDGEVSEEFDGDDTDQGVYETNQHEELDLDAYLNPDDFAGYKMYGDGSYDTEEDRDFPIATHWTLYDSLLEQFGFLNLTEQERFLGLHLLGSIENDGYLRRPLKAIASDLVFTQGVYTHETELENVLKKIQSLEPTGIGARTMQECLLLQLKRRSQLDPNVKLARQIVDNYFDEFSKKHYEKIQKRLGISQQEASEVISLIVRLNHKSDKTNKNVRETATFIKQKLDSAKWFIDAIKQRQITLMRTMTAILNFQYDFFLEGDETRLRPMILKDIATVIAMDVSTVSRVANSKCVQTEFGLYPLKYFFSEGISTDWGEDASSREVKNILRELIEAEPKRKPLSDDKLEKMLNEKGYNIARRTVAKYREQLNIPVARLRKQI